MFVAVYLAGFHDPHPHRTVFGALVVGPSSAELLVAGANGPSVTAMLQSGLGPAARTTGRTLRTSDVVPLVGGDSHGLSMFYAAFGVVLAAFLFGQTSMQAGPTLAARPRLASAVLFAALIGVVTAVVVGRFHALPTSFALTAALVGLMDLAVAATTS